MPRRSILQRGPGKRLRGAAVARKIKTTRLAVNANHLGCSAPAADGGYARIRRQSNLIAGVTTSEHNQLRTYRHQLCHPLPDPQGAVSRGTLVRRTANR